MEFETRKDQIDYVVGKLLNWMTGFLSEADRQFLSGVPVSLYALIALEVSKCKRMSDMPFREAVECIKQMFPSRSDAIEEASRKMSAEDEQRLMRFVRVLSQLVED